MIYARKRIVAWLAMAAITLGMAQPTGAAAPLAGKRICLDAGHGGADPGAVSAAIGVEESHINLDEAYAVKSLLEGAGATVLMTRTGDDRLVERDRPLICNDAHADILVSIHTNSFPDAGLDGLLVLQSKATDVRLARALHDTLYPLLDGRQGLASAFLDYGVRRYRAAVLRRSTMPAALVEPYFLSNPQEATLLSQPIYSEPGSGVVSDGCPEMACRRGVLAQGIYRALLEYFEDGS